MERSIEMSIYVADFETTTTPLDCRVWGWGLYEITTDTFEYGNTMNSFFERLYTLPDKSKIYFHNLKFDGEFMFYYLFNNGFKHTDERKLENNQFSTLITYMGVFYSINIKYKNKEFTFLDSLKVIPLPVRKISKAFKLEQIKGEIDYVMERPIGYKMTKEEIAYLKNDVEIVGKALLYFFNQNLNKMTQASNAFYDYKKIIGSKRFSKLFPQCINDSELRQSYKGGFSYVNPKFQNKELGEGIVLDVNSLYPSVMYYCMLPYGEPIAFTGKYVEDKVYNIYIQMIRCNFELKEGHLPTIQMKHTRGFAPTEYATDSKGLDVVLCLTSVDMELFFEHYNVYNIEYFEGWKFKATNTLFREYIDKWTEIKINSSIDGNEGMRTIAKLMLNALYGKFGLNPVVKSKTPVMNSEGFIQYKMGENELRDSIYIPVASFVTAYARKITISSAQKNYDRFAYADTDSLHLIGTELPQELNIDNNKLGYWKHEGNFNKARFLRAKSYIENMIISEEKYMKLKEENKKEWEFNSSENLYEQTHVACAGLPHNCHEQITFDNFKDGLTVGGKLQHNRVKGGVILKEIDFTIKI